ncbi:hypothetical protein J3R83DRAFT_3758 [Lanmaoa asiatica]|nr:hypothetical protein J3R83DRAFT_3758 [Lanmaoa asiatica]
MGTRYVVLNFLKATKDLLEKKSAIMSNRPHFTMGGGLVGWGASIIFLQYDDTYRKHRKFFHRQIGTKISLKAFYPAEEAEVKNFLCNVLRNPDDLVAHSRKCVLIVLSVNVLTCYILGRTAGSVILKISHGYTVKEDDDLLVEMANKAMHNFSVTTTPGRFLVDILPICTFSESLWSISVA